jgi:hypothetical protein
MGGVLIDGGWSEATEGSVLPHPDPDTRFVFEPSAPAAGRHLRSAPATRTTSADQGQGELILFPSFAHPSYGYPDFAATAPRRRSIRRRQRRRVVSAVAAGALLLGTASIVTANELGTHSALASARSALNHARSQRNSYEAQLNQAQQDLSSAQSQNNLQAGQIGVLKTCLNGVLDSLSYAANNDYTDAIATINGVSGACTSASTLLGPSAGTPAPATASQPATTTT